MFLDLKMDITTIKTEPDIKIEPNDNIADVDNHNKENYTDFDGLLNSNIASKLEKTDSVIYYVYYSFK